MPIKAVILDVDGTLIDSNDAHAEAWVEVMAEEGRGVSYLAIRKMIGMGGDKMLEALGIDPESEEGEALVERRGEIFRERYMPQLRPLPGARDLALWLREQGYTVVVASSAQKSELELMLEIAGVDDLLDSTTSASEVEASKPDPDIVRTAVEKAGEPAESTIMIGDTPYDIEAARGAGVRLIAVRSGGWSDEEMAGAIAVFDDPADLLRNIETTPLSPGSTPSPGRAPDPGRGSR